MKCKSCRKDIRKETWYSGGPGENYCSEKCAMDDLEIDCVCEYTCAHCHAHAGFAPYMKFGGETYCSIDCALAANHIKERTR